MKARIRASFYNVSGALLVLAIASSDSVIASGIVATNTNGSVGYIYRSTNYSTDAYDNQHLLKANIDNTFFIWRDWFITGSSSLVFTQDQTASNNSESSTFSTTGQLGFSVLPQSSTPFGFSYSRSDSKVNSDLKFYSGNNAASLDDNVVNESLVLHQSLLGKGYRLKVKYSDSQFNSSLRGKYGSNKIGVSGVLRNPSGVLRASMTQSDEVTYNKTDRQSNIARLNHNYTGISQTVINTVLSRSQIQQTLPTSKSDNNSNNEYDVTLSQASVSFIWRSLNKKMSVTSGLRFSGVESASSRSLGSASSSALSVNLGLNYRLTDNMTLNVNSSRAVNEFEGGEATVGQDRLGVTYRSDKIQLGDFNYDWRFSGDLARREHDGEESNSSSLSLGHGVGRKWSFARSQHVFLRGGQDYSINSLEDRVRQRLSHRVSLGWKHNLPGMARKIQFQLSDQRDMGDETALQTLNAEVSQQMVLTRRIKLNGSLNYQLTDYQYSNSDTNLSSSNTSVVSANANLSYMNPFSISGLAFTSNYRYSQSVVAQQTDLTTQQTWNNKVNYRVGKIDVSLQFLYREARKIRYNSVYFSLRRVF